MHRKRLLSAMLALAGTSGLVVAQDSEASMETLTGTVIMIVDGDGASEYYPSLTMGPRSSWGRPGTGVT